MTDLGKSRKGSSRKGKNPRKACTKHDKLTFISNLVRIFRTEYNLEQYSESINVSDRSILDPFIFDKRAVEWKFGTLDTDKNENLTKVEYKDLKKLVRKVVKPKRCSRAFIHTCDTDHSKVVSKIEWMNCLSQDAKIFNKKTTTTASTTTTTIITTMTSSTTMGLVEDYEDKDGGFGLEESYPEDVLHGAVSLSGSLPSLTETEVNDCVTDRKEALDDISTSSHKYVPECASDGRYKRVQCYKSVGYCWCAQEDTGKPIPGTSVKDSSPNCDGIPLPSQPMKGCPEHIKNIFLKDFMNYLNQKYRKNTFSSDYESIYTNFFHSLDANRNEVLERKEWKSFRKEMSANRKLRRCGKKLPRHCDVNCDNKIDLTEWFHCLNVKHMLTQTQPNETSTMIAKRRGPNPLESYLKGDD